MTLSLRWDISTVHEGKKVKFDNVLNFAIRECLKNFNSIRQLQPSNFISNWNIPTDVALCHLMPQFLKLFSTLKGFLNLLVCPTYFSAVFFCSSSFGRAGKLYQFFQLSSTYLLQTKKLEIKGFFSRKSQLKIISPLDLHFSIVSGFETQQDWSQFSSKCKFEQHYTFCHNTIYV